MCVIPIAHSTNLSQVIYSMIKHNYPSQLRRQCPPPQGTMVWCVSHFVRYQMGHHIGELGDFWINLLVSTLSPPLV